MLAELEKRRELHLHRERHVRQSPMSVDTVVNGQRVINFCSNNYLGLANHPQVITAFQTAAQEAGVGAGCASLIGGYHYYHQALEEALAEFLQRPRVLLFNSGYMQNLGLLSCLIKNKDKVFADRLVHASLLDGVRLSHAQLFRYKHSDVDHLNYLLEKVSARKKYVLTDSIFSMDGDLAPLSELSKSAEQSQATLIIDDAHGFGTLGRHGRGVFDEFPQEKFPWVLATLGKALGVYGGFISADEQKIEYLIQHARSYIYTTALPPAIAAAALCALEIMQTEYWRRETLHGLIRYFQKAAKQLDLPILKSSSPIQPLMIGDAKMALRVSEELFKKGYHIAAIRPPSVESKRSRLRITLTADHTKQHVDALLTAIDLILKNEKDRFGLQYPGCR